MKYVLHITCKRKLLSTVVQAELVRFDNSVIKLYQCSGSCDLEKYFDGFSYDGDADAVKAIKNEPMIVQGFDVWVQTNDYNFMLKNKMILDYLYIENDTGKQLSVVYDKHVYRVRGNEHKTVLGSFDAQFEQGVESVYSLHTNESETILFR